MSVTTAWGSTWPTEGCGQAWRPGLGAGSAGSRRHLFLHSRGWEERLGRSFRPRDTPRSWPRACASQVAFPLLQLSIGIELAPLAAELSRFLLKTPLEFLDQRSIALQHLQYGLAVA